MKPSSPAPNLLKYWIVLWCGVILIVATSSSVVAVDVSEEIPNGFLEDKSHNQHNGGMTKRKDSDSFGAAAWGGPHSFRTWSRQWLNYPGACDLVLLHDPHFGHGLGLAIHIRTTSTAPTTTLSSQYSSGKAAVYLEQAALRIGTDVLQVNSSGQYYLNGIQNAALPAIMGQVAWVSQVQQRTEYQQQILEVDLDHYQDTKIIFQTFQERISVSVEVSKDSNKQNFLGSIGLLGANLNGAGDVQARDGATFLTESSVIGKEWQVRDTDDKFFQDMDRFPQYPNACIVPSHHDDNTTTPKQDHKRRRLSEVMMLSKDDAREVCAMWKHDKKDMAACMYDVLFTGKLDTALIAGIF